MPPRVTVGERSLAGHLELTRRRNGKTEMVSPTDIIGRLQQLLADGSRLRPTQLGFYSH